MERLKARETLAVLQDICRSGKKDRIVTVHMAGGASFCGAVLDCRMIKGYGQALLLKLAGSGGMGEAAYIHAERIETLVVHDASAVLDLLSEGELSPAPSGPAPTKLALSRRAEEVGRVLSEELGTGVKWNVEWETIPEGEAALRNLSELLEDAGAAMKEIIREYGAEEIRKTGVTGFTFRHSAPPGIVVAGSSILVTGVLDKGPAGRSNRNEMKKALESAL
ncbi:MAG: hypothetical protein PHQ23_12105 [Candidatus Wallbacteria bacterium]|nr:hypothetical protein [Candidatus Wallbacteria bacterium]